MLVVSFDVACHVHNLLFIPCPMQLQPVDEAQPISITYIAAVDLLDQFSKHKRSVFSAVSSVFVDENEGKVTEALQQLQHKNVWPMRQREILALELIRNVDKQGKEHCQFACSSGLHLVILCHFWATYHFCGLLAYCASMVGFSAKSHLHKMCSIPSVRMAIFFIAMRRADRGPQHNTKPVIVVILPATVVG